jgi:hypothetical protein
MMLKVEMSDMANVMNSISHYEGLSTYFPNLASGEEGEILTRFWNEKIVKREEKTWLTESEFRYWCDINFHVIKQTWGNTAGGWQGIGGSAMTPAYTLIIENGWYGFACIYYSGKLAYICEMDDKYTDYKVKGYRGLPGCRDSSEKLTVLFKGR